jgi:hypothetical protein
MAKLLLLSTVLTAAGVTLLVLACAPAREAPIDRLQRADGIRFGELVRRLTA